jgi:HSP20 family protein
VNRLFDQVTRTTGGHEAYATADFSPAVDIVEQEGAYVIHADLPGVAREDLEIHVENNVLTLAGEKKRDKDATEDSYRREERSFGRFSRTFTLPRTIDAGKIEATIRDGVLRLSLPKAEAAMPRKIVVG